MKPEQILTPHAPAPIGPYSQAIQIGSELYCSGQIPLDPQTGEIVEGDVERQTERVIENIGAVLCAAGCQFVERREDDDLSRGYERFRGRQHRLRAILRSIETCSLDRCGRRAAARRSRRNRVYR